MGGGRTWWAGVSEGGARRLARGAQADGPFRSRSLRGDRNAGRSCEGRRADARVSRRRWAAGAGEASKTHLSVTSAFSIRRRPWNESEYESMRMSRPLASEARTPVAELDAAVAYSEPGRQLAVPSLQPLPWRSGPEGQREGTHRSVAAASLAIERARSSVASLVDGVAVAEAAGVADELLPSLVAPLAAWGAARRRGRRHKRGKEGRSQVGWGGRASATRRRRQGHRQPQKD